MQELLFHVEVQLLDGVLKGSISEETVVFSMKGVRAYLVLFSQQGVDPLFLRLLSRREAFAMFDPVVMPPHIP